MELTLVTLPCRFAVCKLEPADATIPVWAAGEFLSIARTSDELSVVCRDEAIPEGIECRRGWRCMRVAGTIAFSAVGVLASLSVPLAEAGISIFVVSTYNTDYLLVQESDYNGAVEALRQHGHTVQ